jgi:glutamine---fructose-6-phosphate transaminase (isomerizing)
MSHHLHLLEKRHYALEIYAGPEIAVASTKAYIAQIAILQLLAYELSITESSIDMKKELSIVANAIENFLANETILSHVRNKLTKETVSLLVVV